MKEVFYAPVSDISFTSAKKMKKKLDKSIDEIAEDQNQRLETIKENDTVKQQQASTPKPKKLIPFPCEAELKDFYAKLNDCKTKPATLDLVHPYSESSVLKSRDLSKITDLYDNKYLDLEYHELIKECSQVTLNIFDVDIKLIEKDTRNQSKGNNFSAIELAGLVHL